MVNREHSPLWLFLHAGGAALPPAPCPLQLPRFPGAVLQLCPRAGTCGNPLLLQEGSLERHHTDTQAPVTFTCGEKTLRALSTGLLVPFLQKFFSKNLLPLPSAIALFCFRRMENIQVEFNPIGQCFWGGYNTSSLKDFFFF